jgi:hypothetical protein
VVKEVRNSSPGHRIDDCAIAREVDEAMWLPEYARYEPAPVPTPPVGGPADAER